ncbi:MAG: hypothetical protein L0H10_06620 [Comamonas sp.]|uniref:hypothetical protein n=1 Tax=Comamonas TaxID=283 RepID=UPI0026489909|nr:hypothetical protein [Comamonas sp.]MDN5503479.1 hypothetical protein [Comamonas sp.]MDN5539252.1 hypothetical protein [Comamonas sp.]
MKEATAQGINQFRTNIDPAPLEGQKFLSKKFPVMQATDFPNMALHQFFKDYV